MQIVAVSAHDIDAAGIAVDAALPAPWLDGELGITDLAAQGPGRIKGRLSRSGNAIVVRSKVVAELTMPCARCLAPATVHVDTDLSLLLKPAAQTGKRPPAAASSHGERKGGADGPKENGKRGAAPAEDEYEFSSAEADEDTYDGETVVLDPFIREAILLEIPNFPLCSEACPGIRPAAEPAALPAKTIDPRLAPLSALRAKLSRGNGEAVHDGGLAPKPPGESSIRNGVEEAAAPRPAARPPTTKTKLSSKSSPKIRSSQLSPKKKKKKKE
jgi:uncharacterized protein